MTTPTARTAGTEAITSAYFRIYPNPATSNSTIDFRISGEEFDLGSRVDTRESQLKVFTSEVTTTGRHQINIDLSSCLAGYDFVRIMSDKIGTQSRSILKLQQLKYCRRI